MIYNSKVLLFAGLVTLSACLKEENDYNPNTGNTSGKNIFIETDKACYLPGDKVTFSLDNMPAGNIYVRYRYLDTVIEENPLSGKSWDWTTPAEDFKGYMVQIYEKKENKENSLGTIAVDVSSDAARFPRYGFLSKYESMPEREIENIINNLNRHHINWVQYQDWHYKHHKPLAGTPENPDMEWIEISNRHNSFNTISRYIGTTHKYGMKSIFYNLCFGALEDAEADGVKNEWYIFKDANRTNRDVHALPKPMFWSDIYLTNPGNTEWQAYLAKQNDDVYRTFAFDGYQIDQLGNRGSVYDYNGKSVDLTKQYAPFIASMKNAHPDKSLIMNAVSQFGQEEIARSEVDFLYTEVWGDQSKFTDLKDIIDKNNAYSNQKLKTVFAAYMNYNVANGKGYFNTPGVLLTDAVMFALGGSHLELGEHMLGKEYFPNNNLQMKPDLKNALINYYDFLVGYQNLLRDGGEFNDVNLLCTNNKVSLQAWPPATSKVVTIGKKKENKQIVHLINLSQANRFEWRDIDGDMPEPTLVREIALQYRTLDKVAKVWVASPDIDGGAMKEISFRQNAASISFMLPSLKYWNMLVIEFE